MDATWRKIPSTSNQNAIKEKRAVEKMQEVSGGSSGMGPQELANMMNSQGHRYLNVALVPYNGATYLAMPSFGADPAWIVIGFLASFIPAVCHYTWIPAKKIIWFKRFFVLRTWDPIPTIWHLHGEATGHLGFHTIYHTCSTKRIFLLMSISVGASQLRRPLKCHWIPLNHPEIALKNKQKTITSIKIP